MVRVGREGWMEWVWVSFEFVVKSPMGGVFYWQMTRERCQSQCQTRVCTSPPRTLQLELKYPLFIATLLFKGFPKILNSNLVVKISLFYHSLDFLQSVLHFGNLNGMDDFGNSKLVSVPLTNFFLFDFSPRPMSWRPRWRSWRSSSLPVRQTGGGGCGTWPRSGGGWWSVGSLPGPWPPEIRDEREPIIQSGAAKLITHILTSII